MQKQLCLIGAIIFIATCALLSIFNWQNATLTISQHVALYGWSSIWFGIFNTVSAACIGLCLLKYLPSRWRYSSLCLVAAWITVVSLFMIGWFPYSAGLSAMIHQVSAWTLFIIMAIFVALFAIDNWRRFGLTLKISAVAVLLYAAGMSIMRLTLFQFFFDEVFYLEFTYLVLVLIFIIIANYIKPRPCDG